MKKTLSEQYSFLNIFKSLIIISVVIYTIFFLISIEGQLEIISQTDNPLILIISVLTYILFLVSSVGGIMIINFLFKLDKTKNNLEGEKTNYYGSGEKLSEGTYKDGELDGLFTEWYENGQKRSAVTYKSGNRQGLGLYYTEDGQIKYEVKSPVTDIDGNSYKTIRIADQIWMAENLKVTHYRNGDAIPTVQSDTYWNRSETGAYTFYDNNESNVDTYGCLYNWFAVNDPKNIAPVGWHVPTDDEWQELVDYLGGSSVAAGKIREAGTAYQDRDATNESGFTALPGGYRDDNGDYRYMGSSSGYYFWSSTEIEPGTDSDHARYRILEYYKLVARVPSRIYSKRYFFSVRCIKDSP